MDITNIVKLLDAGFTKEDIMKITANNLLDEDQSGKPMPEEKPEKKPEPEEKPEPEKKSELASDIGEKLDKLIALTLANNFGAENPFNPNASEKAATDFFANIIAPDQGKEGAN